MQRRHFTYYITNKRLIHQFKFLIKRVSTTTYNKIQDLNLTQGIIGRIFSVGSIHINTAGSERYEVNFLGVKNPDSVKKVIEEQLTKKNN